MWRIFTTGEEPDDLWWRGYPGVSMCSMWILDRKEKEDTDIICFSYEVNFSLKSSLHVTREYLISVESGY